MEPITISADLANAVWNYIAGRPFAEVAGLANPFREVVGPQMDAIAAAKNAAAANETEAPAVEAPAADQVAVEVSEPATR